MMIIFGLEEAVGGLGEPACDAFSFSFSPFALALLAAFSFQAIGALNLK
jgi:hypothetical protein